jgi:hypothetical protein
MISCIALELYFLEVSSSINRKNSKRRSVNTIVKNKNNPWWEKKEKIGSHIVLILRFHLNDHIFSLYFLMTTFSSSLKGMKRCELVVGVDIFWMTVCKRSLCVRAAMAYKENIG